MRLKDVHVLWRKYLWVDGCGTPSTRRHHGRGIALRADDLAERLWVREDDAAAGVAPVAERLGVGALHETVERAHEGRDLGAVRGGDALFPLGLGGRRVGRRGEQSERGA